MAFWKKRIFTEGELEYMNILWEKGECKPQEIMQELRENGRIVTYGTVRNVLLVLIEKGFARRTKTGMFHLYRPAIDKEYALKNMVQHLLNNAFGGSKSFMVKSLLKNKDINIEELDEIERIIYERKKEINK
ncbi:BlaI/MecI/CopY family transcriptional regulator [Candidatus Latescibacterota bacterium]